MSRAANSLLAGSHPRRGIALLMVLLIVMAVTVLSAGFLVRTDSELACGQNMLLRMQMDQLANSALEHTRGLFLHPQDVEFSSGSEYWQGATGQQLIENGSDYYDMAITRDATNTTDYCTYDIRCEAYRRRGAERTGQSFLQAQLRLDPCVALWTGADLVQRAGWSCYGDLYAAGAVDNAGRIDGDVFATALTGTALGRQYPSSPSPVAWPQVTVAKFISRYPYATVSPGPLSNTPLKDPSWIFYCQGDLIVEGNVTVAGMLLVEGNLTIRGNRNVIQATKDLSAGFVPPALYVTGDLILRQCYGLTVNGLAVVDGNVWVGADTANVAVTGGLFAAQQVAETAIDSSGGGNDALVHSRPVWSPAGGQLGGGALQFDGDDDYLQTPNSSTQLQLPTGDYTISVWLKPAPTGAQNPWAGVVTRCSADGLTNHWTLQFGRYGDILYVYHSNASAWDTGVKLADLQLGGIWHHVAIVRQGTGMTAYLDGGLRKTEMPALDSGGANPLAAPGTGHGHLNIGAERDPSANKGYQGLLDDVRIYSCSMGAGDVQNLYAMKHVASGLIGHWKLDEVGSALTVKAQPMTAAIVVPTLDATMQPAWEHWSPAAGALFKDIRRP